MLAHSWLSEMAANFSLVHYSFHGSVCNDSAPWIEFKWFLVARIYIAPAMQATSLRYWCSVVMATPSLCLVSARPPDFPTATALSLWLRRGHGTACRHLSHRCLRWRPSGVSWRRNCLSKAFLIAAALPTTASNWHSVHILRRTRVFSLF